MHFVITASNLTKLIDSGMAVLNLSVGDERKLIAVFGNIALLRVTDFTIACKEGYYGPDCSISCTPRDDSTGHFTCDEDGTILCLPGYQNTTTNCVEEVAVTADVTQMSPLPESTTAQGDQDTAAVVPMAVGGAVGGSILLLFIIVGLIAVIALACKSRKQEIVRPEGDAVGGYGVLNCVYIG